MRYAIFSDVHANFVAWDQAFQDICSQKVDALVCLGDAVGYGPRPEEVLHAIRSVTTNFVMGNHDAAAAGVMDYSIFNDNARHSIEWTISSLSEESRQYLAQVPLAIDTEDILFVHAEISEPGRFGYIDNPQIAKENFANSDHFITFVGHTHHPTIYQQNPDGSISDSPDQTRQLDPNCRYIVNVGSVGEPRNPEDLRGVYVIYDSEKKEVEYRKITFDIEAYRRDLQATTLNTKPFFLQCYESQTPTKPEMALAMEAPAIASPLLVTQSPAVRLHIPSDPKRFHSYTPAPKKKTGLIAFLTTFGIAILGWFVLFGLPAIKESRNTPPAILADNSSVIIDTPVITKRPATPAPPQPKVEPKNVAIAKTTTPKPKPIKPTFTAEKPPTVVPSKPPPQDSTISYWRMNDDSIGSELIDSTNKHPLVAVTPGTKIANLAPAELLYNESPNNSALSIGVWTEPSMSETFSLKPNRSFTLEGWFVADKLSKPVFIAGTRSGENNDGQGWHADIRPPTSEFPNGQMCFFYDNGIEIIQALSADVVVADLKNHHFAVMWNHLLFKEKKAGRLSLFLDGKLIASTKLEWDQIPTTQANLFRIGSPNNPPRIGLDEVRFSRGAIGTRGFLYKSSEVLLFSEDFETPDVKGYAEQTIPANWVGSNNGLGSKKLGLIEGADRFESRSKDGNQGFRLSYTNTGLTTAKSVVKERLTAGNTYRLTFRVAVEKDSGSYHVELVAFDNKHNNAARADATGRRVGVVLASKKGATKSNKLVARVMNYHVEPGNPHIGKEIGIRIIKSKGTPIYDSFQLHSKIEEQ